MKAVQMLVTLIVQEGFDPEQFNRTLVESVTASKNGSVLSAVDVTQGIVRELSHWETDQDADASHTVKFFNGDNAISVDVAPIGTEGFGNNMSISIEVDTQTTVKNVELPEQEQETGVIRLHLHDDQIVGRFTKRIDQPDKMIFVPETNIQLRHVTTVLHGMEIDAFEIQLVNQYDKKGMPNTVANGLVLLSDEEVK
jgi:hypothetical protein